MKVNTALSILLASFALWLLAGGKRAVPAVRAAQLLAVLVAGIGIATLGEYLYGWFLGIDELLFRDDTELYTAFPGRMSPYSAAAFTALGIALALAPWRALRPVVRVAAIVVLLIGAVSFFGYVWNVAAVMTDQFLPPAPLTDRIGKTFHVTWRGRSLEVLPLPHPSGASPWHRMEPGISVLHEALAVLRRHPAATMAADATG